MNYITKEKINDVKYYMLLRINENQMMNLFAMYIYALKIKLNNFICI